MTDAPPPPPPGTIGWTDLTVPDAERIRAFYEAVVGWRASGVEMGGYEDWVMEREDGTPVAGICHRRGVNADLPSVWLVYVTVADLDRSLKAVEGQGGMVLVPVRHMGAQGRYAVIRDPAGATLALFEHAG